MGDDPAVRNLVVVRYPLKDPFHGVDALFTITEDRRGAVSQTHQTICDDVFQAKYVQQHRVMLAMHAGYGFFNASTFAQRLPSAATIHASSTSTKQYHQRLRPTQRVCTPVACHTTAMANPRIRKSWPPTPFSIKNVNKDAENPQWMYFVSHGLRLSQEAGIAVGWNIRALVNRLSDIGADYPCPDYFAYSTEAILQLIVNPRNTPTVAVCISVLVVFERLLVNWGVEEIKFRFGVGKDIYTPQGVFLIAAKDPTPPSETGPTD